MAVNGYSFEDVTHMEAVEVMKSDRRLVMTVKVSGDDDVMICLPFHLKIGACTCCETENIFLF